MDFVDLYVWIQTVAPEQLPPAPFEAAPGVTVKDPPRWLAALQQDGRLGPNGARARYGAIQADLRRVYELAGDR
jgi:hypothetical protein